MKRTSTFWDTSLVIATMLIASICAHAQAQQADEGKVVRIDLDGNAAESDVDTVIVDEPAYWIGVRGRSIDSAVLRTHLQLAEDMGVVVEEVLKDSPAAKAGLRKHDIILRVNGDAVDNMRVLQQQVLSGKHKPLELKIIRLGQEEKLVIVPEVRPEVLDDQPRTNNWLGGDVLPGDIIAQLGGRDFGPGMVFRGGGQAFNLDQMPNGVSVSIQRDNNGPAQITVQKDGKTWKIEEGDEESLKQLPDDLRPFVQRMLNRQPNFGQAFPFGNFEMEDFDQLRDMIPRGLGEFRRQNDTLRKRARGLRDQFDAQEDKLQKKMEQLEQQLKQLQQRFEQEEPALPPEKTS